MLIIHKLLYPVDGGGQMADGEESCLSEMMNDE